MKFIEKIKFDKNGLIPVVIQDIADNKVLMLAYMNKEAIERTLKIGKTCFWSRSRKKYWVKGEESGNFQIVKKVKLDCDGDALLIKVQQIGKAACHDGYRSCFYRQLSKKKTWETIEKKVFDPRKVYKQSAE